MILDNETVTYLRNLKRSLHGIRALDRECPFANLTSHGIGTSKMSTASESGIASSVTITSIAYHPTKRSYLYAGTSDGEMLGLQLRSRKLLCNPKWHKKVPISKLQLKEEGTSGQGMLSLCVVRIFIYLFIFACIHVRIYIYILYVYGRTFKFLYVFV